ncbi:hypothetical protein ACOMHN_009185 [Nucella lapillus]
MAARKKVGELQDYKDKRRRDRELNNLEQRILLDQIAEGQTQRHNKHKTVPWSVGNRDRLPLAKDKDVRHLQIEYERAREKGFKRPNPVVFAPQHRYRKPYLPETVTPRYNPNTDPKVQQLAEIHGRQMEHLQNRNRDLERQREEIRRRLEELGRRPPEKDNSTDELLRELREQEARNQRLLNELRLQLAEARRPINVVQQHAPPGPQQGKRAFVYPIYYGNSLVAEIIACRQAYLQNGGNDPDILAQLAQMLAEAQAIDDSMKNVQRKQPKDKKDGSSQLLALEFENERLQRQLMLLQEQKIISGNRRKDNHREDDLERELQRMHRDHLRKMQDLHREMERIRQETLADRMRIEIQAQQQPPPLAHHQPPAKIIVQHNTTQPGAGAGLGGGRAYVDLESMAPYDQYYSPRRAQAYGHTWDQTLVRSSRIDDPYYLIYI